MCGIFGQISTTKVNTSHLKSLSNFARRRGVDSSGFVFFENGYNIYRANKDVSKLLTQIRYDSATFAMGHSRLITNGLNDNQPVVRDGIILIHNGIVINEDEIWAKTKVQRQFIIDSEAIIALVLDYLSGIESNNLDGLGNYILSKVKGTISAAIAIPGLGKLLLISNNGSLYYIREGLDIYFASESHSLKSISSNTLNQLLNNSQLFDIPLSSILKIVYDSVIREEDLIPDFRFDSIEESHLEFHLHDLKRCTKCILPETMPYIEFNEIGECNYCTNYKIRNKPKPKSDLEDLVEPFRNKGEYDCIVPFSGGRDSCYSLHIIVKEMGLKPLTFTYDWGMVTDLARRNISRMCQQLGVENIVVAANISKKRDNIRRNLNAWLRFPDLGMVSILTAGDKHFHKYNEIVKDENNIELELWGTNPLEITHFKAGFLRIKPDFLLQNVYISGLKKQLGYQIKRFKAMLRSPRYFNRSILDTLSGEYYRSIRQRENYFHLFNYWQWEEHEVNSTLAEYGFEKAPDTNTTWRIGDGTAAFYNYIYYTVAGFTEHDTFRSNQIREGQLTRPEAMELINDENKPRYQNIRWYLDALNMDFKEVISVINQIPKLYKVKTD